MLHACKLTEADPAQCLNLGDAQRDIEAGRNANLYTSVACYGYLGAHDKPESWQADAMIQHPSELSQWI
jgi:phosphoglycolate phosphatase